MSGTVNVIVFAQEKNPDRVECPQRQDCPSAEWGQSAPLIAKSARLPESAATMTFSIPGRLAREAPPFPIGTTKYDPGGSAETWKVACPPACSGFTRANCL